MIHLVGSINRIRISSRLARRECRKNYTSKMAPPTMKTSAVVLAVRRSEYNIDLAEKMHFSLD